MFTHDRLPWIAVCVFLLSGLAGSQSGVAMHPAGARSPALPAAEALLTLGPEGKALAERAGTWDVTFTGWSKPGAVPVTTTGLTAEREMIGPMLQERLRSSPAGSGAAWTRIDDLTYNRLENRWDYMSMDTRAPVGLMPAYSVGRDPVDRIVLSFLPFATPGNEPQAIGQLLRMEQIIIHLDNDHKEKDQYFMPADGAATRWLAKRYTYTRRRG